MLGVGGDWKATEETAKKRKGVLEYNARKLENGDNWKQGSAEWGGHWNTKERK